MLVHVPILFVSFSPKVNDFHYNSQFIVFLVFQNECIAKLESLGFRIGQSLVERYENKLFISIFSSSNCYSLSHCSYTKQSSGTIVFGKTLYIKFTSSNFSVLLFSVSFCWLHCDAFIGLLSTVVLLQVYVVLQFLCILQSLVLCIVIPSNKDI